MSLTKTTTKSLLKIFYHREGLFLFELMALNNGVIPHKTLSSLIKQKFLEIGGGGDYYSITEKGNEFIANGGLNETH